MRIVCPTKGLGNLDDLICRYFGQAEYFVVAIVEKGEITGTENHKNQVQDIDPPGTAAERTAQTVISQTKPDIVILGEIYGGAEKVFKKAGVKIVRDQEGKEIKKAVLKAIKK